eukprot:scaffold27839_cov129-Isochrysis_galbana.AAC.3
MQLAAAVAPRSTNTRLPRPMSIVCWTSPSKPTPSQLLAAKCFSKSTYGCPEACASIAPLSAATVPGGIPVLRASEGAKRGLLPLSRSNLVHRQLSFFMTTRLCEHMLSPALPWHGLGTD